MKRLFFLLPFFPLLSAHAATYYVDYASGSDAANGTSTGTPWKHCPGDAGATGTPLATVLAPGDTVNFNNAVTYITASGIALNTSGSSGNAITYDGSTWGVGTRAIITTQNAPTYAFSDKGAARSYIAITGFNIRDIGGYADSNLVWTSGLTCTVDPSTNIFTTASPHGYVGGTGLKFTNTGGAFPAPLLSEPGTSGDPPYYVSTAPTATTFTLSATLGGPIIDLTTAGTGTTKSWVSVTAPPGGAGVDLQGGGNNAAITNCLFAEIGQWINAPPMSGINSVTGVGVALQNNAQVSVTDCDFTRMKSGVSIKSRSPVNVITDITLLRCSFHNSMNWLVDIAPRSAGGTLSNLTIDTCSFYDYHEWDTPNWAGFGEKPHQDGIFLRAAGQFSIWTNVVIRNSTFYSDQTSNGGTASIYLSQGSSADIYNCLFLNDQQNNAYINVGFSKIAGMTQVVRVWNNTFVGGARLLSITPGSSNPDVVDVRNNLFDRLAPFDIIKLNPPDIGSLTIDNNRYFGPNAARCVYANSYLTLPDWQTYSGKDGASTFGDPMLVSIEGPPSTWNVRPAGGSPLNGAGQDLSAFFTTDITGATRTTWDIGAYNYTASNVAPAITTSPLSQSVASGTNVIFTAAATGVPTPTWQWKKGGVDIPGATSATYTITGAVVGDAGTYTAVATNVAGSATSSGAVLIVAAIPPTTPSTPATPIISIF